MPAPDHSQTSSTAIVPSGLPPRTEIVSSKGYIRNVPTSGTHKAMSATDQKAKTLITGWPNAEAFRRDQVISNLMIVDHGTVACLSVQGVDMMGNVEMYSVPRSAGQTIASHGLYHWPVLPEESRRIVKRIGLHFNTASLPSPAIRYLKIEGVARSPRVFMDRLSIAAHFSIPPVLRRSGTLYVCELAFRTARLWRDRSARTDVGTIRSMR